MSPREASVVPAAQFQENKAHRYHNAYQSGSTPPKEVEARSNYSYQNALRRMPLCPALPFNRIDWRMVVSRSTLYVKNTMRKTDARRTADSSGTALCHTTLGSLDTTTRKMSCRHSWHRIGALIDHVSFCDNVAFVRVILRTPESVVPES